MQILRNPWTRLPIILVVAYVAVLATVWAMQDRLIFPGAYMPAPNFTSLHLNKLDGMTLPGPGGGFFALVSAPKEGRPVVIAFHGNGMYPEDFGSISADLVKMRAGVIAPAYPGYPRSPGHPSEAAIHAMAEATYDWVRATYPASPVIVLGHSLGSGPAVRLAARHEVSGLILLAPFLSLSSVAVDKMPFLPVSLLLSSPFRNDLEIPNVTAPVLTMHGNADQVIPATSGEALMRLAKPSDAFVILKGIDHEWILSDKSAISRIHAFVEDTATTVENDPPATRENNR